jgi:hypothetical protein
VFARPRLWPPSSTIRIASRMPGRSADTSGWLRVTSALSDRLSS